MRFKLETCRRLKKLLIKLMKERGCRFTFSDAIDELLTGIIEGSSNEQIRW